MRRHAGQTTRGPKGQERYPHPQPPTGSLYVRIAAVAVSFGDLDKHTSTISTRNAVHDMIASVPCTVFRQVQ